MQVRKSTNPERQRKTMSVQNYIPSQYNVQKKPTEFWKYRSRKWHNLSVLRSALLYPWQRDDSAEMQWEGVNIMNQDEGKKIANNGNGIGKCIYIFLLFEIMYKILKSWTKVVMGKIFLMHAKAKVWKITLNKNLRWHPETSYASVE